MVLLDVAAQVSLMEFAWQARCPSMGEKLVLLACAYHASKDAQVRIDPLVWAGRLGMSVGRVEAAISALHRAGLLDARRWEDSGCWSARVLLGGKK